MTMPCLIGFSTGRKPISRIIRWITGSRTSHSFLVFHDETLGIDMVMESDWPGVVLTPFREWQQTREVVELVTPKVSLMPGVRAMTGKIGTEYDYLGLVGMAWVYVGRWLKKAWRNPFNTRAYWCSELVAEVLQHSGYPGADRLNPSTMSPQDLLDFLNGNVK